MDKFEKLLAENENVEVVEKHFKSSAKGLCKGNKIALNKNLSTDEKVCVFVELKGSDVAHAVKQLDATLSYPLFAQNRAKWTKARIVANKIPANTGRSVVERAKVDFRRKYNCELICLKSGQPDFLRQEKLK